MRTFRTLVCLLLCLALLLPLTACDDGGGYRIVDDYSGETNYYLAFRKGDRLRDYVSAALQVLASGNTLRILSSNWFGEDLISVRGNETALEELQEEVPHRTITVGVDISNMPLSYFENDGYRGFDVELIGYVCGLLGWDLLIYPIDLADATIELNAGNIDVAMSVPESDVGDLDVSPAYLTSRYVLVARTGSHIRRRSGLKGKTLGVTVADERVLYTDEKFVKSLGSVTYQTNTEGLFQALMMGEVDGVLSSSLVTAYYMK